MEPTTTTCIISNYNYARFLGEAIDSALRQTVPFDEIIVVDDGSTDGSMDVLNSNYGQHPVVQIVAKENRGQLSCFNEGLARSTGQIVFFLDADDVYQPDYVERAMGVYRQDRDCDFVFCARRLFGDQEGIVSAYPDNRDLGYSVITTAYFRDWIGAATSCLSMRRHVLDKILPLPFVDEWRVRADDCLVFGASLAGARKRFLAQPLVKYRVHGKNHYRRRAVTRRATYRRRLAINRLFEFIERKLHYNVTRLADFSHREFRTIERPSFRQLVKYSRVSLGAPASIFRRLTCVAVIAGHYIDSLWPSAFTKDRQAAADGSRQNPIRIVTAHPSSSVAADAGPAIYDHRRAA